MKIVRTLSFYLSLAVLPAVANAAVAVDASDINAIKQAALDYIESQHKLKPEAMERALHPKLAKRTFWKSAEGDDFVMETSYDTMLRVAATYNRNGDKFPSSPRKEITILDAEERVASVKLTADDWIDYMHLIKSDEGQWQIVNVLWRFHDGKKHDSSNK